ncbi:MAG: excinuclease ABC subunit A [Janthinobacterium lividum]
MTKKPQRTAVDDRAPAATPASTAATPAAPAGNDRVRVRGAREHNLKNVDVDIPRNALVVFTGVSGSGKSSLAFGTLYAEAQRRYFESVAPYARRLIDQVGTPAVDSIHGLPPAVALQQQRGTPNSRSSVGSVTHLSDLLRMLYSRTGSYPPGQPMLYAEDFSPNLPEGACPVCHGLGRIYEATERSMVLDDSLTIRERAVSAWPPAWHGQNLRDILVTLGHDVDTPWRDLPRRVRDWILFTDEQPTVPVYAGLSPAQTRAALKAKREPSYQGTFSSARRYLLHTFATTQSALMKKRVARYLVSRACPECDGKRLKRAALSVTFNGYDIGALSMLPLDQLEAVLRPTAHGETTSAGSGHEPEGGRPSTSKIRKHHAAAKAKTLATAAASHVAENVTARAAASATSHVASRAAENVAENATAHVASPAATHDAPERSPAERIAAERICQDVLARVAALIDLGLGYLSLERSTPTLSPGELQRLRLATQLDSELFGVVYVLDEPSAGLHPADGEALIRALARLKEAGNSLFVVEHDPELMRRADWLVDVGPGAGELGGEVLYSGPPAGLADIAASETRRYLFPAVPAGSEAPGSPDAAAMELSHRTRRTPTAWLEIDGITRNNLQGAAARFPLGCLTAVTGVSGSGKSTLVSQVLPELVSTHLGQTDSGESDAEDADGPAPDTTGDTSLAADDASADGATRTDGAESAGNGTSSGRIVAGIEHLTRLVRVDQKPIGRTPRSNLATYTGLFDQVRKLFAATPDARRRRYDASRFSFNVAKGRCPKCEGEGSVSIELLFMPSVYAPCPVCDGARYNPQTLEIVWAGRNIAEVLGMTVGEACVFFADETAVARPLGVLRDIGLGYLRLGQPATELSGGEAQRIKLATELQRAQRGNTLYILDEPTTGLHPADVDRLMHQLQQLADAGNTLVLVEHDMRVVAQSDWVIDMGPGAGARGGQLVAAGVPETVARCAQSATAPYLARQLGIAPQRP